MPQKPWTRGATKPVIQTAAYTFIYYNNSNSTHFILEIVEICKTSNRGTFGNWSYAQ